MNRINRAILSFVFLFLSTVSAVEIKLNGYVPPDFSAIVLHEEYVKIRQILQPGFIDEPDPVTIIFYSGKDERILGVRLPEWGGGGAIGTDSIIIPVDRPSAFYSSDLFKVTLHELVHIAVNRTYGYIRIPRWVHEGLAMALSGEIAFDEHIILSKAVLTNSLIPLDSIEKLNFFPEAKARIAYSQCHFAMRFLLDNYGYDLLPELLNNAVKYRNFETAAIHTYGLTTSELQDILTKEISARYRFAFLFSDSSLIWFLILLLAVVGFMVTRSRKKQKMLQMEYQEQLETESIDSDSTI